MMTNKSSRILYSLNGLTTFHLQLSLHISQIVIFYILQIVYPLFLLYLMNSLSLLSTISYKQFIPSLYYILKEFILGIKCITEKSTVLHYLTDVIHNNKHGKYDNNSGCNAQLPAYHCQVS